MSGPPRKPPGPPPSMPAALEKAGVGNGQTVTGLGMAEGTNGNGKRAAPGPPPGAAPVAFKPPPTAPPPRSLLAVDRPAVDSIKAIDPSRMGAAPPPRGLPTGGTTNAPPMPMGIPPRVGPPPRALAGDFKPTEFQANAPVVISNGNGKNGHHVNGGAVAPEKSTLKSGGGAGRKQGAIAMFDEPDASQEPADKKSRVDKPFSPGTLGGPKPGPPPMRADAPSADPTGGFKRSLPPSSLPAGIPVGQPLPPDASLIPKDSNKFLGAPPPVKPAPERGRAPPREEPKTKSGPAGPLLPSVLPEAADAPFKKGKKEVVVEEVYVPRRERDHPEFEESSSDEEGEKIPGRGQSPAAKAIVAKAAAAKVAAEKAAAKAAAAAANAAFVPKLAVPEVVAEVPVTLDTLDASIKMDVQDGIQAMDNLFESEKASEEVGVPSGIARALDAEEVEDEAPPMKIPPSMGVALQSSSFVPPPPADYEPEFDHSRIGKELPHGRLSIKCISGINIRRKDEVNKIPKQDPFLKFKLGAAERHPWKSTEVRRKQTDEPDFENEIVFFDITDPQNFVFNGDLQLNIECLNKGTFKEESMGSVSLSVVRFLKQPFVSYTERIPIYYAGAKTSQSKLVLEIVFEEARPGLFELTLFEAKSLRNVDPMGKQHPYVKFKLGKTYTKRSKTIKDGATAPYFGEEKLLIWADRESWVDDLQVLLLDEDMGEDKPIGQTHFSFLAYMNKMPDDAIEDSFDLFYYQVDPKDDKIRKEIHQGELVMRVRFYPAGRLKVTFDKGAGLKFPESYEPLPGQATRMDPYVNVTTDSQAVQIIKRTPADKDGGADPSWKYDMFFDIVDQYLLNLEVFHQAIQGTDILLGTVQVSLLSVFRGGKTEMWTTLKQKKANGGIKEVGEVFVALEFVGPTGIAFPQLRPEVDSFDDTVRKMPSEKPVGEEFVEVAVTLRKPQSTIPGEDTTLKPVSLEPKKNEFGEDISTQEFTDEEIIAAFKFIDLDHNNFVGAREIRHILVCMGEMITDEEIDCMISMVDMDGDGQVSLQEFRTLVLHPDPGMVDMHKEVNAAKDKRMQEERQMMQGKLKSQDLSAYQRQRELTMRESKKKALISYINDNECNFDAIKNYYQVFTELPKERRPGGRVKFAEFCICLGVEPITEYRLLHSLFDNEEMGDSDMREILLGLMNFVEVEREARIRYSFLMFDELKTGYISHKEVEEILRGNHMIGLASVQRKADTVMKQASVNNAGAITMNEFVVCSKK